MALAATRTFASVRNPADRLFRGTIPTDDGTLQEATLPRKHL
jgi:hypothetical protein